MSEAERRVRRWLPLAASGLVVALRWACRARMVDGWDDASFVLAVERFDLARFSPHFPGYPVYVVLCKCAHTLGLAPLDACLAVSALAGGVTAIALHRIGVTLGGARAGWCALGLWAGAFLPWLLGGSALSDGTAAALFAAALALAIAEPPRPLLAGALAGLMMGARLSYAPLAMGLCAWTILRRRERLARTVVGLLAGTLAWLIPFVALVGPRALWAIGRAHLVGHFTDWGGSVVTDPSLASRAFASARDLFYDSLFPSTAGLVLAALLIAACLVMRRPTRRLLTSALLLAGPYALWAFVGQNVVEQPRHLLPLVVIAILGLAWIAAARVMTAIAIVALAFLFGAPLAIAHATQRPSWRQILDALESAHPGAAPKEVALLGTASLRMIGSAALLDGAALVTREAHSLGEVDGALERLPILPRHPWLTSEIAGAGAPTRVARPLSSLTQCRDARLDRAHACMTVFEYEIHIERPATLPLPPIGAPRH